MNGGAVAIVASSFFSFSFFLFFFLFSFFFCAGGGGGGGERETHTQREGKKDESRRVQGWLYIHDKMSYSRVTTAWVSTR